MGTAKTALRNKSLLVNLAVKLIFFFPPNIDALLLAIEILAIKLQQIEGKNNKKASLSYAAPLLGKNSKKMCLSKERIIRGG